MGISVIRSIAVAGVALASVAVLSGCVLGPDWPVRDSPPVAQQEEEEMSFLEVEEAVLAASESITEVRARLSLSGLSQRLSLRIAVPSGEIAAEELRRVLAATEASMPSNLQMILIRAVTDQGEGGEPVSIAPQLSELGVPQSWIVNDAYATIPVTVVQGLVP